MGPKAVDNACVSCHVCASLQKFPQRKDRVPQYSHTNLEELQQKFDELEKQGVFCTPDKKNVTAEYHS